MSLTLSQLKDYVSGVLKGWFKNKPTLDKLQEDNERLMYNGHEVILLDNQYHTLYEDNQVFKRGAGHQVCSLTEKVTDFNRLKIFWEDTNSNRYCTEILKSSSNNFEYYSFNLENIDIIKNVFNYTPVLIVELINAIVLQDTNEYYIENNKFVQKKFETTRLRIGPQTLLESTTIYGVTIVGADWKLSSESDNKVISAYEDVNGYYLIAGQEKPYPNNGRIPTSGCFIAFNLLIDCNVIIREKTQANKAFYVVDENEKILVEHKAGDSTSFDEIKFSATAGVTYYAYMNAATANIFEIILDTIQSRLTHIYKVEGYKY